MSLVDVLADEVGAMTGAGAAAMRSLEDTTDGLLAELRRVEAALEQDSGSDNSGEICGGLAAAADRWYADSIGSLKHYNTATNRLYKNVLNNTHFSVDIDDAYVYKLNLDNIPSQYHPPGPENPLLEVKAENQQELTKAIVLHLLKIGQSDIVDEMLDETIDIDQTLLQRFAALNDIVRGIVMDHDLRRPLAWFQDRYNEGVFGGPTDHHTIEFKFHMLQFTLLLNAGGRFTLDNASAAYLYSKEHFPRFFGQYLHEISPLMTLLLFKTSESVENDDFTHRNMVAMLAEFAARMRQSFARSADSRHRHEAKFVEDILASFDNIHANQSLFTNLSSEFISHYCHDMNLSNDSSLFQSILAGYIHLPSFYKYNKIQSKFAKVQEPTPDEVVAPFSYDMPFQLSDISRFLFNYHPIFICPVSKDQLIPLTIDDFAVKKTKKPKLSNNHEESVRNMANPVVVLKYCQHVALKESIWQLSKRGSEIFKCHYCYKKHKINEVKEGYFIDL